MLFALGCLGTYGVAAETKSKPRPKKNFARSGHPEFKTPVVVVVSPLLSLMHDQVSKLVGKGVKAVCVSCREMLTVEANILDGRVTHVFESPEAFVGTNKWHSLCQELTFAEQPIAIGKAHCIVNCKC